MYLSRIYMCGTCQEEPATYTLYENPRARKRENLRVKALVCDECVPVELRPLYDPPPGGWPEARA